MFKQDNRFKFAGRPDDTIEANKHPAAQICAACDKGIGANYRGRFDNCARFDFGRPVPRDPICDLITGFKLPDL